MTINVRRTLTRGMNLLTALAVCAVLAGFAAAQPPGESPEGSLSPSPDDPAMLPTEIAPLEPSLDPDAPAIPGEDDPEALPEDDAPNQDALDALNLAQQAMFYGDYDAAFEAIDEALAIDPDYADAYLLRSLAHRILGEYQQSVDAATRAIELDPDNGQSYHNQALAFIELKQYQRAVAACEAALAINPNDATAMYIQGTAHYVSGDYRRAVTSLTAALDVSPRTGSALPQRESVATYLRRGMAWYHLGEYDVAIDDFSDVIRLSSAVGVQDEAFRWRGFVLAAQGKFLEAIRSYDEALHVNRANALAHKSRGIAYLNLAATRPHLTDFANVEAIQSFNQMIRLKPDEARAYYYRGVAYQRLGEAQMAHASFSTAAMMDPDHADARRRRDQLEHFWPPIHGAH